MPAKDYEHVPDSARVMRQGHEQTPRLQSRRSLLLRAALWIAISLSFLIWNGSRIFQFHAAGLPVRWWAYVQIVLWLAALSFWLWMGWRELKHRVFKQQ